MATVAAGTAPACKAVHGATEGLHLLLDAGLQLHALLVQQGIVLLQRGREAIPLLQDLGQVDWSSICSAGAACTHHGRTQAV
jgi:hypothetical protein